MNSMIRQHHLRIPDVKAYLRTFERNKPLSPDEWAVKESSLYDPGFLLFCLEPVAAPAGLSSFSKRGEEQGETFRVKDMCVVVSKDDGKCVAVIVTPSAYEFRVLDSLLLEKAMKAILDGRDFNYLAARPTQRLEADDVKALYKLGSEYAKGGSRRTLAVEGAALQEPASALIGQLGAKLGTQVGKQLIDIGSICHMIFTPEGRQEDKSKAILKSCFVPVRAEDDGVAPAKSAPAGEQPLYSIDPMADVAHLQDNYSSEGGNIDLSALAPEAPQQVNYESPMQQPAPAAGEPSSSFGDFGMGLLAALAPQQPAAPPLSAPYDGLSESGRSPELPSLPFGGNAQTPAPASAPAPAPLTNSSETLPPSRPTASYTGISAMDDGPLGASAAGSGNGHGKGGVAPWYVMSHEAIPAPPQATAAPAFQSAPQPAPGIPAPAPAAAPAQQAPPAQTAPPPQPATAAQPEAPREDFSNQFMADYQQGHAGAASVDAAEKEFEKEKKIKAERERGKEQRLREYFGEEHFQKYVKGEISEPDMEKVDAWQLDPSHYHAEPAEEGPNFDSDIFANAGRSTLETNPEAVVHEQPREEITGPPPDPSWSIPAILEPPAAAKKETSFDEMLSAGGELPVPEKVRPLEEPMGVPQDPRAVPNLGILDALQAQSSTPPAEAATFAPPEPKELGPLAVPVESEPQPNSLFNRLTGELSKEPAAASPSSSLSNLNALPQDTANPSAQPSEPARSPFAPPESAQQAAPSDLAQPQPTTYNWAPPANPVTPVADENDSTVITSGANWPAIPPSESLFAAPAEDLDQPQSPVEALPAKPEPHLLHPTWNTPPEAPVSPAETAVSQAESPMTQVETPVTQVKEPAAQVETPAAQIETPAAQVETPTAQVETPAAQVETPAQQEAPQAQQDVEPATNSDFISKSVSASGSFSTTPKSQDDAVDEADSYTFPDAPDTSEAPESTASPIDAAQQPRVRPRDYSSPLRAPKNLGKSEPLSPLAPAAPLNPLAESAAPATSAPAPLNPLADNTAPATSAATPPNPLADLGTSSTTKASAVPFGTSSTTQASAVPFGTSSTTQASAVPTETPVTAAPWSATQHLASSPAEEAASETSTPVSSTDAATATSAAAATPLPFRPKPAASISSDSLPAMPAPAASAAASGSQDARLMMNEMASLMAKLEMQVAKAANKLASRAEELRGRLSQQVDGMVKEAQEVEKQSESNLSTLASELKTKLDNLSAEVQSGLAKDAKNAEISVEEMAQNAWDKLEREQTQLTQEITRSTEEFRKDLAKLTSIVNGRLDGLIDTRNKELAGLSDSILAQLKESHDAYSALVAQRYERFEQRMNEETASISSSLERNMKSMVEEIETSLDRACEKLKSTRFELEQTVAHTIAMSEMAIAQKAKNLLTENLLPRLNEQKEIMRTMISDMSKQIKDESVSSLDAEVAKLEQATTHTADKLRKVASECVEEVESTGRGIKTGLEDHFKRASGDLLVRTREVGDKIRETERRMADSEFALKGLAEASTVDSEPELNEERNHAVSKLASLKLEASKQLSNTIEQNLDGLDSKGEGLFSELSNKRSELTSQVRDSAESNLHKIRQALQEATNAIRSAQEKHME